MVSGVERDETSSSGVVGVVSSSSVASLKGPVRTVGIHCSSSSSSIIVSGREYQELAATAFLTSPPKVGYSGNVVGGGGSGTGLSGNVAIPSSSNPSTTNSTIIEGTELSEHHHHHHHLSQESVHHHHHQQQQQQHQDDELGAFRPQTVRPGRRVPPGPGFYHRTLSSSCLFSNKVQVAKSRSEYCGINQVCHSGSNYDLLSHGHNANLNPNIRNNLSSSGSIVYRGGGGGGGVSNSPGGISFVDSGSLRYIKEPGELVTTFGSPTTCKTTAGSGTSGTCAAHPQQPPPPDRRHLVRGLSRNAFINIPSQHHQEQQQFYWQQQQQQPQSYQINSSFEQQQQNLQYSFSQQFIPKRRVGGSHPDISSCRENFVTFVGASSSSGGGGGGATNQMTPLPPIPQQQQMGTPAPHQVSINIPSSSPTATRRLLPRITKKTDTSSTVHVVGGSSATEQEQQHMASYSRLANTPTTSKTISSTNPHRSPAPSTLLTKDDSQQQSGFDSCYISCGGGVGGRRTPENINLHYRKKDLTSSSSSSSTPSVRKKTESLAISQKEDSLTIPRSTCTTQVILMQDSGGKSREEVYAPTTAPAVTAADKRKLRAATPKISSKVPSSLNPYYRNAPITKLKHPLEENIFSSLFITLFAVGIALVIGVPILCGLGVILIGAVGLRYCFAVLNGLASYTRFLCSNRTHPASRSIPPNILPRDRLAFANDVRWLGKRRASRCQSILHTLLVFEGSMDVSTLRHLIQTRVLRAETPEGELAYPRLLQKLVPVTAGYLWELDLAFDIQNHIFPGPNHFQTEHQLQNYIGHLLTQSLPLSKPLWEIRVLPSYYGGGKDTMAVLRVHQCLADGMSLIRILSHALADHQQMHIPQRPHFAGMSFGFNVIRSFIVGPVTIFLWWFATFRDKTLFSIPLPKLRKRRRRKLGDRWRAWWRSRCGGNRGESEDENDDENEYVMSYGSTISHTSSDSKYSSKNSLHSGSSRGSTTSSSSANAKGKFVRAFRSPLSSGKNEVSPQVSNQIASPSSAAAGRLAVSGGHEIQNLPGGQQSTAQPVTPLLSSSSRHRSLVGGILSKGVLSKSRQINAKCLGKRTTSRSSLKCQNQQGKDIPSPTATTTQRKFQRRRAGGGAKKRKKKKRKRRKRFGGKGKRKGSLGSATSSSTFSSDYESPSDWNVTWSAPMSVPKVARVKQIMRSSYNDVLLSAAAGSVRMYLQELGIPYPGDVQVVIPVDLRNDITSPKQSTRLGCKVASVLATVPSGTESAIPRLWATRHRLEELKASADSVVAYGATAILMNILPHRLAIPILESITNKASLQFSNLPGPTCTTVIGGYPLKGIYPIYPPPGRIRAAITVFTYADQVHVTVVTHRSLIDAGPKLLKGMTEQVDQLSRQLSQRRVPGESRRSTRNFNQGNNQEITKPPTRQIQLQLQVVQEELAHLNSRLEAQGIILSEQDYLSVAPCFASPGLSNLASSSSSSGGGGGGVSCYADSSASTAVSNNTDEPLELSNAGQVELHNRLKSLKTEFAELIGELRRRSSIVEGITLSFEDEETEEEYRKPRKRALSVVSMTRRSSIFSSRSNTAPESPVYSSDEELPSSPPPEIRPYATCSNIRHTSSPMRTTAV
ncbi:unnamed protein product [Orchesella dallaii]|uniref:Diacylglycerol O-acyltransferase n=1 Tax=Orchesella dallaii TaxID=48710 RepID=A0ABP1R9U9_9HEXA